MYKKAFFAALLGVFFYANTSIAAEPEKIVKNTVINLIKLDNSEKNTPNTISEAWIKFVMSDSFKREAIDYDNTFEKPKSMNEANSKDNFKKCTE
jgi:hypothetical protein